jgi:hypothetical protein
MTQMIKYNFLYLLFFPLVHFGLLELFSSMFYPLYFLSIFLLAFVLYKNKNYLDNTKIIYYIFYWSILYLVSIYLKDIFYDVYIDYDFSFRLHSLPLGVVFILSFMHIFILFLLGYNKRR